MGAFFTNLQVLVPTGTAPRAATAALVEILRQVAVEQGFRDAAPGEAADRTVFAQSSTRWLTIYDEATEGQDEAALDELARRVSAALQTPAVTVLVHDSDVLRLGLFDGGRFVHRFDSCPDYFGEGAGDLPSGGDTDGWRRLLLEGQSQAQLDEVMHEEKLFAEDTLLRIAGLVGFDPKAVVQGFAYAEPAGSAHRETLRLRLTERPAHESPSVGPPRFEQGAYSPVLEASVGHPLRAGFGVRNAGGTAKGLDVVVWGPAASEGLVAPRSAELVIGNPAAAPSRPEATLTFEQRAARRRSAPPNGPVVDHPARAAVAQLHRVAPSAADEQGAVGAEGHAEARPASVRPAGTHRCRPCGQIPESDLAVAHRCQAGAVGAERYVPGEAAASRSTVPRAPPRACQRLVWWCRSVWTASRGSRSVSPVWRFSTSAWPQ